MQGRSIKTLLRATLALLPAISVLVACDTGDFDQRLRADIEEQRADAFDDINTNPSSGFGTIIGRVTTGGPLFNGRVVLLPVDPDGSILDAESDWIGNTVTEAGLSSFNATMQSSYTGPLIVRVNSVELGGQHTSYAYPALATTSPFVDMDSGEELLGYVLDVPNSKDSQSVSPLTTLAVERAQFLGGISSGNLAIASRQVAAFFGFFDVREDIGRDLVLEDDDGTGALALDLAQAAISQIARNAGVNPAKVWKAMRLDIRDDGELNASIGFIPGTSSLLPDLSAANVIGTQLLREGYLAPDNEENISSLSLTKATAGSTFANLLDLLDTARAFSDTTLEVDEWSHEYVSLKLSPGDDDVSLGVRAFERIGNVAYLVVSSDGPTVAQLDVTSSDPGVCQVDVDNRLAVPANATSGAQATITVRLRPDGVVLTGGFDETLTIQVTIN